MKKKVFGRQFKRDTNERKALFKGLMTSLVMLESIQTTEHKAKAIKAQVEKLVTKAKVRGQESRQFLQPYVSAEAVEKLMLNLAVRFAKRPGGYTRIIKLGNRFSDNAAMAVIEWVEKEEVTVKEEVNLKGSGSPKKTKSTEKEVVEATIIEPKKEKKPKKEVKKADKKPAKKTK